MAYPSPLTQDIPTHRFGTPGNSTQPIAKGIKAAATVYRGSIAVTRSGYLVAGSSPQTTDVCWGIIDKAGAGAADTGPGITGGTTDGGVAAEISTGSFWVNAGTGVDALTVANEGGVGYMINEFGCNPEDVSCVETDEGDRIAVSGKIEAELVIE